jgi:hypothetical protein
MTVFATISVFAVSIKIDCCNAPKLGNASPPSGVEGWPEEEQKVVIGTESSGATEI